jgi:hypothetical protein
MLFETKIQEEERQKAIRLVPLFGYLPLGGAGDANISARQTSHLSGPYFQFVMRSGIIFSDQKT